MLVLCALLVGCSGTLPLEPRASPTLRPAAPASTNPWPSVPPAPTGELTDDVAAAVDTLVGAFGPGRLDRDALDVVARSGDARLAWLLADLLRFATPGGVETSLVDAFATLTGVDPRAEERFGRVAWVAVTNLLIGWDLPAPPGYRERKAALFLDVEPAWERIFADEQATIDWRWLSWGGVLIDDRELGDAGPCRRGCIPALDDPVLVPAAEGAWYADWRPVFGVVVGEQAVAFPKHIMEVHELVNLTIGGRRIGLPYCTLCASAQAYLTDAVPGADEPLVLRTSGLLSRSNKVMMDLASGSTFNTFTGRATSGPLRELGVVLEQVTVVATSWGEWKAAHPSTTIVARDAGIGRTYPDDPLEGRDEAGPVFPVGPIDARLPAQHRVVGVVPATGPPVAFPADQALAELAAGRRVRLGDLEAFEDGGGLRVRTVGGEELPAHAAFWFAWSQFHPGTAVWSPLDP